MVTKSISRSTARQHTQRILGLLSWPWIWRIFNICSVAPLRLPWLVSKVNIFILIDYVGGVCYMTLYRCQLKPEHQTAVGLECLHLLLRLHPSIAKTADATPQAQDATRSDTKVRTATLISVFCTVPRGKFHRRCLLAKMMSLRNDTRQRVIPSKQTSKQMRKKKQFFLSVVCELL